MYDMNMASERYLVVAILYLVMPGSEKMSLSSFSPPYHHHGLTSVGSEGQRNARNNLGIVLTCLSRPLRDSIVSGVGSDSRSP